MAGTEGPIVLKELSLTKNKVTTSRGPVLTETQMQA